MSKTSNTSFKRPIYGTTLFLASCKLKTRFGKYTASVFQDLMTKEYSVALSMGDISKSKPILCRIHSSCLTSETLRSFDSDDVQQLELALKEIQKNKRGILYYFIQEGRGAGFIAKAIDRMLVQSNQNLTSHEAFKKQGLKDEYRSYARVKDINQLLNIKAPLIILTNNPHKFSSLTKLGIKISKTKSLEIHPTIHSKQYLVSKQRKGHTLLSKKLANSDGYKNYFYSPAPSIKPFKPYALPQAQRFIHAASYILPMKPVNGLIILTNTEYRNLNKKLISIEAFLKSAKVSKAQIYEEIKVLPDNRIQIRINRTKLKDLKSLKSCPLSAQTLFDSLLVCPYWFILHTYWDISTQEEIIVLSYSTSKKTKGISPIVRIQSESLFNRFPLEDVDNRNKLKSSVLKIVENGEGVLVLLHNDGRGSGFGALATEYMMREKNKNLSSEEAYKKMGLPYDRRDYEAAAILIKHHVGSTKIRLIHSSSNALAKKPESLTSLSNQNVNIKEIIFLSE